MARRVRTLAFPAVLLFAAACAQDYTSVLYPSQQVLHEFYTAVDLDEATGEWIDIKTEFYPEDEQIALIVRLDEHYVYREAEIFYELEAPAGFIVEVERKTYRRNVPTGVFFGIRELVHKGRVVSRLTGEVLEDGYGAWTGNFYVDGIALGQIKFEIINPEAEAESLDALAAEEDEFMTPPPLDEAEVPFVADPGALGRSE